MANDRLKELLEKELADLTEDEWKEVRDLVSAVAGIELEKKEEGEGGAGEEKKEETV